MITFILLLAHQCQNYNQFREGRCFTCKQGMGCAIMGYFADTTPGIGDNDIQKRSKLEETVGNKYFLTTGREYPYCR